jgi:putative tryptophan/tyrosine transport system substrate-binding protein
MKRFHQTSSLFIVISLLASLVLSACSGTSQEKVYTLGVINLSASMDSILDGFKSGMTEAGYVEGKNVTYIYDGPLADTNALKAQLESLKAKKVDLIISFGTPATLQAKQTLEGTNIPVIFVPVTDPVKSGIVADLQKPGSNLTGIRTGNPISKRLEWLLTIDPSIKRIFVVNKPDDSSSVQGLATLTQVAPTLNVELVTRDASTPDETSAALNALPEDVDAIFMVASASMEAQLDKFVKAANEHKLPLSAPATGNVRAGALMSFGQDNLPIGRQAARLADQVLRGVSPADLPVESADLFVSVNLKTAAIIGLDIPDDIIRRINIVVR